MTRLVGIDPGKTGAVALLERGQLVDVVDMPVAGGVDPHTLAHILTGWGAVDRVVVEQQQAMPRQGVASTFKTGVGFGVIVGVCAALERPVVTVTPSVWTRALGVGADKGVHRRRAMDLFPAMSEKFARVRDDGRSDAVLLAWWHHTQQTEAAA